MPLGPSTMQPEESDSGRQTGLYRSGQPEAKHSPTPASENGGIRCPRCGEMLMPGSNVCEFCGEVVAPVTRNDSRTTSVLYMPENDNPEPLPSIIRSSTAPETLSPQADNNRSTIISQPKPEQEGQVTLGMLIIICVLVAGIACVITWAIIHFSTDNDNDNSTNTEMVDNTDVSLADAGIGSAPEPVAEATATTTPQVTAETAAPTKAPENITPQPIEGMRESLAGSYTFHGKINNKYSIGIDMKIEPDGAITGCYWYESTLRQEGDKPSSFISIDGEVDDTGTVHMEAQKYGSSVPSEHWKGTLSGVKTLLFKGTMRATNTNHTYTFSATARNPHY